MLVKFAVVSGAAYVADWCNSATTVVDFGMLSSKFDDLTKRVEKELEDFFKDKPNWDRNTTHEGMHTYCLPLL